MKANELMIGDWVKVLPISRKVEAHNSQVGALTRNVNNTISIEGGYFPAWTGWSVGEEYIEPIPLTAEILEKNGRLFNGGWRRYLLNENIIVSYDLDTHRFEYGCTRIENIRNVHELQHALRLCGLNELADNFKI